MKNEGALVVRHYTAMYLMLKCNYSEVGGRVWGILIKFIQIFIGLHVTCKYEEDPFKNEAARVVTKDLPLLVYADFFMTLKGS